MERCPECLAERNKKRAVKCTMKGWPIKEGVWAQVESLEKEGETEHDAVNTPFK